MVNINKKILDYMKQKPKIYEESSSAFWDDHHISKYMLDAHLNPDLDSASRKHNFIQQSVNWINEYTNDGNGKRLLDLGCGCGIYAELFLDKGFDVTGIDFSERSINYAKNHGAKNNNNNNIQYIYQNYLEIDYEDEFDVITLIYCDFGVLSPKDRTVLLEKVWRALKKDGILIIDGFTEISLKNFKEKEIVKYEDHGFWCAKPHVVIQRNSIYHDTANTLEQYLIITENDCACYNIWNQIYSKETLIAEIRKIGFHKIEVFDDVTGKEFTGQEETICAVATK